MADHVWGAFLTAHQDGIPVPNPIFEIIVPPAFCAALRPAVALLGPLVVLVAALALDGSKIGSRNVALAGVFGLAAAILTAWPEAVRLWPYVGAPTVPFLAVVNAFDPSRWLPMVAGILVSYVGWCVATRASGLGGMGGATLQRAASDNHGHADWLDMQGARKRFPGPHPAYGGLVVGEAYRVDQDRAARRVPFEPADRRICGMGGKAPLLVDPCRSAATHALVFAGAGGFKTNSAGIPTLLTWTGSAVVLDPSREMGPMMQSFREAKLGHQVVTLDPFDPDASFNALDWIDITKPAAMLAGSFVQQAW